MSQGMNDLAEKLRVAFRATGFVTNGQASDLADIAITIVTVEDDKARLRLVSQGILKHNTLWHKLCGK
jgi:hypothetical protein